jgi:transposase
MNLSSVALSPVDEKTVTIFMALELSKSTWLVALHSPAVDKISLHGLQGGDTEGPGVSRLERPLAVVCGKRR